MKCIILAAGYATRLYPLTKNFPKPLLEVAGKPILNHLIGDIDGDGFIDEYIVVSNHKFAKHFNDWAATLPQKITILDDGTESNETRLGAVKDIQFAVHKRNINDDTLIMAGDNLLSFNLSNFLKYARNKGTSCVMRFYNDDLAKLQKTGVLELDGDRVIDMVEKPEHPKTHYSCPPFYFYKATDLARIDEALEDGCEFDAPGSFPAWLCQKTEINSFEMPGPRYDIGNLESYEEVKKIFENTK